MEYNEATKSVLNQLPETDVWDADIFQDTEFAMELDRRNLVLEGVLSRFRMLGIEIDVSDTSSILSELKRRYVEKGIDKGIPKSVTNWITKGEQPNSNPPYRSNLYDLCFALEMSLQETREFFLKYYMTIPFNYKDRIDATYYYSLRMNKSYSETKKLLDAVEAISDDKTNMDEMTQEVLVNLEAIQDDDLFLEYIKNNSFSREKQFMTARSEIDSLVQLNAKIIVEIFQKNKKNEKKDDKKEDDDKEKYLIYELNDERNHHQITKENGEVNYNELFRVICGFDNQLNYQGKESGMNRLSKCKSLPKKFKKCFPKNQEFSNIKNGSASAEVFRKSLVIMKFFNFFAQKEKAFLAENKDNTVFDFCQRPISECEELFEDFKDETSACLAKCGFVALYPRNPFDWMILYCAHSNDPLICFRQMLLERL